MADYTPHQKKIIDRYYRHFDAIKFQRLSELVTEIYLAEGKRRDRLWTQVEAHLKALEVPSRDCPSPGPAGRGAADAVAEGVGGEGPLSRLGGLDAAVGEA